VSCSLASSCAAAAAPCTSPVLSTSIVACCYGCAHLLRLLLLLLFCQLQSFISVCVARKAHLVADLRRCSTLTHSIPWAAAVCIPAGGQDQLHRPGWE
jgi:hypothetical protein